MINRLSKSFPSKMIYETSRVAINAMQDCITDIRKWMLEVKLKLNDDKTEFIIIGTRQQLAKVSVDSLQIGNETITSSSEVKNLGSWFDTQLKMDSHIGKCCRTAFFHLFNIRRIRKFLSYDTAQILINAFVTSRLDYCNSLLYSLPDNQIYKLQEYRTLQRGLFVILIGLITLLQSCTDYIGYLLDIELILKYYLSLTRRLMDLHLNIFLNSLNSRLHLDII